MLAHLYDHSRRLPETLNRWHDLLWATWPLSPAVCGPGPQQSGWLSVARDAGSDHETTTCLC